MKAYILYNTTRDAFDRPTGLLDFSLSSKKADVEGYDFQLVASTPVFVKDDLDLCETVFRAFNVVSGLEVPVFLGIRSMSCGDVVVIEDVYGQRAYVCAGVGFSPVEFPEVEE